MEGGRETGEVGPNMRRVFGGATKRQWPTLCGGGGVSGGDEEAGTVEGTVRAVKPIWKKLATHGPNAASSGMVTAHGVQFVGRFFLHDHPRCIRDQVLCINKGEQGQEQKEGAAVENTDHNPGGYIEVEEMSMEKYYPVFNEIDWTKCEP